MGGNDGPSNTEPNHHNKRKQQNGVGGSNGFKSLGLSETVYKGIVKLGFRTPTPVQRKTLPVALSGVDTVAMARTGSGKTCAFLIPLLEKLLADAAKGNHSGAHHVRGLILSPTRELSSQTLRVFHKLAADTNLKAIGIHGGEGMEKQFNLLASKPDVIVATPGRLAHHLSEIPDFKLSGCLMFILDEADRLLEMGFSAQIRQIAKTLPESAQKLLFSATMPKILVEFTKSGFAVDPTVVRLDQEATVSADLRIAFVTTRSAEKDAALLHVLDHIRQEQDDHKDSRTGLSLIFAATRHHVEYITTLLRSSGIDATMIYGSLDQEARKLNLAAFRSGKMPVLVVTDVAARGIDVPLIDHVIHYHFPPSPKLFIHRSGRCARAGRVGFCWGLVDPDELAYMVDLHLFLGRRPSTGMGTADAGTASMPVYSLSDMSPDMVHYGAIPESVLTLKIEDVQRIMQAELSGSLEAESLRALTTVCKNAMKQYRRTRAEASREGIRRARAILEGERLESGQRIGNGFIPPHPLFLCNEGSRRKEIRGLGSAENLVERERFLTAMSNFRPKETVFESLVAGGSKELGIVSQVDKGRTTASHKKNDLSAAVGAMRDMRRQMRISRGKGDTLVVAGSAACDAVSEKLVSSEGEGPLVESRTTDEADKKPSNSRRPLSRAERRQLKKNPELGTGQYQSNVAESKPTKLKRGSEFRDASFFMEADVTSNSEEAQRYRRVEAALQPSAASAVRGSAGKALRMEETMLDILGDESEDLVKKQRLLRWDKSKRKYVQTTVGDELGGESKSKRLRLENGAVVKSEKMKLGELYEKWQKRTNLSVGRSGVFDDPEVADSLPSARRNGKRNGASNAADDKELKSAQSIKKERAKKQNLKVKNMKRSERRVKEQRKGHSQGPPSRHASRRGRS